MGLRRGWRERIEPGVYRVHRVACPASDDERPGRRCGCPLQIKVPALTPGATRMVTIDGTLTQARSERRRMMAAGRPTTLALVTEGSMDGTLHELALAYFKARTPVLAPSTIKGYSEAYRVSIAPKIGHLDLAALSRERLDLWLADLLASGSWHAAWKARLALRAILRLGVEWGRIPHNPAAELRLPTRGTPPADATQTLDGEQLGRLLAVAARNPRILSLLMMAGEGGLRRGELLGLRWPDVDVSARRVRVERAVWWRRARPGQSPTYVVKPPKTGEPRVVAMSAGLAEAMAAWREQAIDRLGHDPTSWCWPARQGGGPSAEKTPYQALRRIQEDAGLVDAQGKPLISLHQLRHTCASLQLEDGVSMIAVSHHLGHASPQVTSTVYAHLVDRDRQLDEAVASFDRRRARAAETVRGTVRGKRRGDGKAKDKPISGS
jgi:integrase